MISVTAPLGMQVISTGLKKSARLSGSQVQRLKTAGDPERLRKVKGSVTIVGTKQEQPFRFTGRMKKFSSYSNESDTFFGPIKAHIKDNNYIFDNKHPQAFSLSLYKQFICTEKKPPAINSRQKK